jgi:hypothetical protein
MLMGCLVCISGRLKPFLGLQKTRAMQGVGCMKGVGGLTLHSEVTRTAAGLCR